jgi:hypothetical protein
MPWRAFFLSACLAGASLAPAAPASRSAPPLSQFGQLDTAEARTALDQLRRQGIAGDYYLELQIRVMPRRGEERLIRGHLWGGRNAMGPLTRVALDASAGAVASPELRLLIQNGRESGAWRWRNDRGVEKLGVTSLFEPLIPDTELTAFDLQMPFLFWDRFEYEGLARFRGRPAHVIVLRPPTEFAAKHPALTGVRVHLDTQFNALVQTELLGERDTVTKTLSLVDLKRIGEQWVPKTFDLRDERTRNKTRVSVTAAALGLDFAGTLFEPVMLADEVRPPDPAQTTRIEP